MHQNVTQLTSPQTLSINQMLWETQAGISTNVNADEHPTKQHKYILLIPEQFERIMNICAPQQDFIPWLTTTSPSSILQSKQNHISTPAYCSNAKYEEISSHSIKPPYDGNRGPTYPIPHKTLHKLPEQRQVISHTHYHKWETSLSDLYFFHHFWNIYYYY